MPVHFGNQNDFLKKILDQVVTAERTSVRARGRARG